MKFLYSYQRYLLPLRTYNIIYYNFLPKVFEFKPIYFPTLYIRPSGSFSKLFKLSLLQY